MQNLRVLCCHCNFWVLHLPQEVIENPMDFGTIRAKLAVRSYTDLQHYADDMQLVVNNAKAYNEVRVVTSTHLTWNSSLCHKSATAICRCTVTNG
eukprot:m.1437651 g.1437651  ORF g.1437651 m.1437651 type:complete len:95 (+) comp25088_c0_seq15:1966-2250(+)